MKSNIIAALDKLEQLIEAGDLPDEARAAAEWGGADVIICSQMNQEIRKWHGDQPRAFSVQDTAPRRRVVVTEHSRVLSWLFGELRDIFRGVYDYITKYDFFGLLAQSAIDYLEDGTGRKDAKGLLLAVLVTAKGLVPEPSPSMEGGSTKG